MKESGLKMSSNTSQIVYHYTSPEGIFSILKNKTIWLTDSQYLNDKNEFLYIKKPIVEAAKDIHNKTGKSSCPLAIDWVIEDIFYSDRHKCVHSNILIPQKPIVSNSGNERENILAVLRQYRRSRYYVFCTSKKPDTCCMWNYYTKNNNFQGYNIGVDSSIIIREFEKIEKNNDGVFEVKFIHNEVIYDEQQQYKECYDFITELNDRKEKSYECYLENVFNFVETKKLFYKNSAFESEQEYRFVLNVANKFFDKIKDNNSELKSELKSDFRIGNSGIITPYIEWNYKKCEKDLIKQITIAPMVEKDLAKDSFKRFVGINSSKNIKIINSSIDVRF